MTKKDTNYKLNGMRWAFFILGLGIVVALLFTGISYTNTIDIINHSHKNTVTELVTIQREISHLLQAVSTLHNAH